MHQQKTETGQHPASTAYRISSSLLLALAVAIIFCSAGLLCFVVYDDRMMIGHVFNSDLLLPVSFMWNLRHDPATWTTFQLPRIPSIFPDLVAYGTLDAVLGDFRAAIFGYSVFQCIAFACAAGWVISQVAHTRFVHAAALFLVLTEAVILVDLCSTPIAHHFEIFAPVEHFGAFLMSLVTVALVMSLLESWRALLAALLTICCFLAFLSNRIFMFEFVLPLGAALLVLLLSGRVSWSRGAALVSCTAIGVVAAAGADRLLTRQPDAAIERPLSNVMNFLGDAPGYLHAVWLSAIISLGVPYLVFAAYPFMKSWWSATPDAGPHRPERSAVFLWSFAATAIVGILALGAALYTDPGSYRYLTAPLFWPLIFVAVMAIQFGGRYTIGIAWCALLGLSAAFMVRAHDRNFVPGVATWQNALATCLLEQRDRMGLKAGIAEYWLSRPATIATNWTLQVDPVVGDGTPYVWGNNWQSYRRSILNSGQAPEYNFIVVDKLNPAALVQKFGQPERTALCGSYTLWVYAEPIGPILLNQRH
ncbi:MAG TPA: hypothetical protein VNO18_03060 [Xanthobacteraceae bacterium]|jgi:hypothetical protein|nr:hypothetical protein [Xanthobacteraceae bacterium]